MTYMERALRDAPPDYGQDAVKLRDAADRCAERGWFDMADTLRRAARLCDVEARKPLITIGETPGRFAEYDRRVTNLPAPGRDSA